MTIYAKKIPYLTEKGKIMRLINADAYMEKVRHEAKAMPKENGEDFIILSEWIMEKTPTVELTQDWISVKEKLPESLFIKTLISAQDKKTGLPLVPSIAIYDGCTKTWDIENAEVIAWMPLPESYQGE